MLCAFSSRILEQRGFRLLVSAETVSEAAGEEASAPLLRPGARRGAGSGMLRFWGSLRPCLAAGGVAGEFGVG